MTIDGRAVFVRCLSLPSTFKRYFDRRPESQASSADEQSPFIIGLAPNLGLPGARKILASPQARQEDRVLAIGEAELRIEGNRRRQAAVAAYFLW